MDKRPCRRKFKDNPYTLTSNKDENVYIINFIDSMGILQNVEVSKDIFELFDKSEKEENARFYEYAKHLMHENFNSEVIASNYSLEEDVFNNMTFKELKRVLDELPAIQKRRIIKYYFYDMTLEAIAKEEGCTAKAVRFSINIALEKISKKFKNRLRF